ncbi:5116_t:CDS:2 [Diversispora eburnea]|uniref:Endoplasmic reticulum transmembrane protein n=1 Tax=Diversispora eburnea TaxID=1213867 RepID=A0A9N8ZCU8_9GLOM|nr:5116_t:CDS:2 [Diversispora eburnea]
MTLYYTLVFALLAIESIAFVILILPFPVTWRRAMLRWISKSPLVEKAQYILKFAFVYEKTSNATNRTYSVKHENEDITTRTESSYHAKKFYNQRNIILNRTCVLIAEMLKSEDQLEALKKQAKNQSKEYHRVNESESKLQTEIERLSVELEEYRKKAMNFDNLKKQADNQHKEYVRLTDDYNKLLDERENRTEPKKEQ